MRTHQCACAAIITAAVAAGVYFGRNHDDLDTNPSSGDIPLDSNTQFGQRKRDGDDDADADDSVTRVACVGDSITQHACASNNTMPYPAQLDRLLGPSYDVTNFGDSGKTMLKHGLCGNGAAHDQPIPPCGGDCSYWDQPTLERALSSSPDVVTIMMGTNDAKGCNWYGDPNGSPPGAGTNFVADYVDMIDRFKALPTNPKIYVVTPPPLTHPPQEDTWPPPFNMSAHVINVVYPALQRSVAWKGGADGVIDVWTALGGSKMDPALTCDGCHPGDDALTVIARTISAAIARGKKSASGINSHVHPHSG